MKLNDEALELWGGLECTINRIKDKYFDQLEYAGYYTRKNDIDTIAELDVKAFRYPILWEKHQPQKNRSINFNRAENDLKKLHDYKITPIIGLVHHGSGPSFVNFFDGSFETGLAKYAEEVAKKFPHVKYYTPINEPLTTARFCGLYGHWYPHKKDDYSFAKILLSECKATVMAMQAIRQINPEAKLIQTEDLGKTHSTPTLFYQAKFENHRRWLAIDLLCGNIIPGHIMWDYLINSGIDESELYFFLQNKCAPDILGLNYYITSERFLDERLEHYPHHTQGKNFIHEYADVEAIRVGEKAYEGPKALIKEVWKKFEIPIAITEAHLHCHRDEQIRWFSKIWEIAKELRNQNVDIKAVTAWALLGSFGWNKLLTEDKGDYEPGAFDIRSGQLRPLALSSLLKCINKSNSYYHPVLEGEGWWERNMRVIYHRSIIINNKKPMKNAVQPLLILGKTGTLGNAFARVCEARNISYKLLSRTDVDICKPEMIEKLISELKPWGIINATGYVKVDDAESEIENCFSCNSGGPAYLAKYCEQYKIQLLNFSSDLVFDGIKNSPYVESDKVCPINMYGQSKVCGEENVMKFFPEALIIRTSAFFGPWDQYNFIASLINNLNGNKIFMAANDIFISPTYVPDLAHASLDLLIDKESGIWHIANDGEISWAQLANLVANKLNLNATLIEDKSLNEMPFIAKRPKYSVLKSEKGLQLPTLNNALERYFYEINQPINKNILVKNSLSI